MHTREDHEQTFTLRCAWLITPDGIPQQNVRVAVENGILTDIAPVPADERTMVRPIAVMPLFVNAHTHLEFSQLSVPLPPPSPFTDWVASVIRNRNEAAGSPGSTKTSIQTGLVESQQKGVALIGEITTSTNGYDAVARRTDSVESVVCFRELIGFTPDRINDLLDTAEDYLKRNAAQPDRHTVNGLSPHAPYSVHPDLFDGIVDLSMEHGCPIAMHLAESQEEVELLAKQKGPFVHFLQRLGIWEERVLRPGTSAMDYLRRLGDVPNALAIHGNYFSRDEINFTAAHPNIAVVYCPRTHAWFGHKDHPWKQMKHAGATVVLGTDSRASNPDLSIWKELQYLAGQDSTPPIWELLPMITTTAATALNVPEAEYRLEVGQKFRAVEIPCVCDDEILLNAQLRSESAVPRRIVRTIDCA